MAVSAFPPPRRLIRVSHVPRCRTFIPPGATVMPEMIQENCRPDRLGTGDRAVCCTKPRPPWGGPADRGAAGRRAARPRRRAAEPSRRPPPRWLDAIRCAGRRAAARARRVRPYGARPRIKSRRSPPRVRRRPRAGWRDCAGRARSDGREGGLSVADGGPACAQHEPIPTAGACRRTGAPADMPDCAGWRAFARIGGIRRREDCRRPAAW